MNTMQRGIYVPPQPDDTALADAVNDLVGQMWVNPRTGEFFPIVDLVGPYVPRVLPAGIGAHVTVVCNTQSMPDGDDVAAPEDLAGLLAELRPMLAAHHPDVTAQARWLRTHFHKNQVGELTATEAAAAITKLAMPLPGETAGDGTFEQVVERAPASEYAEQISTNRRRIFNGFTRLGWPPAQAQNWLITHNYIRQLKATLDAAVDAIPANQTGDCVAGLLAEHARLAVPEVEAAAPATITPIVESAPANGRYGTITEKQLKSVYAIARNACHLNDEQVEARCQEAYNCRVSELTKLEASQFIDALKGAVAA